MSLTLDAFVRSWPAAPWLASLLSLSALIYLRGWFELHRRDSRRWTMIRLLAFGGGLASIYLALASPIEPFAPLLLQIHMLQHLLLMMVAPPLLWLGWPLFPLLRGLPEPVRTYWVAPVMRWLALRRVFTRLTHPLVAWPVFVAATWLWHTPIGYELALNSDGWHWLEHASFLTSSLLFWYPVIQPYPSRPRWPQWLLFPYLLLADVQNTALSAWLTFSSRVLYPHYSEVPRLAGLSALDDQAAAGVLMWVPGSMVFLFPLFWIGVAYLFGSQPARKPPAGVHRPAPTAHDRALPILQLQPATPDPVLDLLRLPFLGRLLRWRYFRPSLQGLLAVLAALVIVDGLTGPQVSPFNLAGVAPWIHWRGILIWGLLVVGNISCMACPFTLPRSLARRWMSRGWVWPRALRNKWIAVALTILFLWSYEAFALWDSPWLTAWIAISYFVAAFVVDSCFRDAAFCKYVCPVGQFNFVQSLVSPWEVSVRDPTTCATCRTQECLRGGEFSPGCELQLFQPRKQGNLDCTFCLDCVRVCPYQNVGLLAVVPGRTLWSDPLRSGIGRFSRRPDLAALVLLLVFGAFANAAGMIQPVVAWQDQIGRSLGNPPFWLSTAAFYFVTILIVPVIAAGGAAVLSRIWGKVSDSWLVIITRYSFALIPIGFGMWLAHYSFHFLTSCGSIVPVVQRFAVDHGWAALGDPHWTSACCSPPGEWVPFLEVLMLDCGLLLSLYTGFRIAESTSVSARQALKTFFPWAALTVLLFVLGVWIVYQPMEMRGALVAGG